MKKILLAVCALTYFSFCTMAQLSYEKRLELELKDGYVDEKIMLFGKNGFIISSRNLKSKDKEFEWKFDKYSPDLKLVKTESVNLSKKFKDSEVFTGTEHTHTLFKDSKGNFNIVSVESENLTLHQATGTFPKKTKVDGMTVLGDYAIINASIKSSPFIFTINWKTGERSLIPIIIDDVKPKKTSIIGVEVLEKSEEIMVYINAFVGFKKSDIYVIQLDNKGEKKSSYNLTGNIEENLTAISSSKINENNYVFTGTYSSKSALSSEGIFFCKAEKGKIDFIKFHNFLDLNKFLDYLPERTQARIEKKKYKKENKGKELKINYNIAAHGIIVLDDGYLFLGEAYYPTYYTRTYTTTETTNGVSRTVTHTERIFDGYQYTHAMLSKFDKSGNIVWDQVFELWSAHKPFYVKRFITIAGQEQNSIKLAFATRNVITTKSIDFSGKILSDSKADEIETSLDGDKTKRSSANILFWYENYFMAYGLQKIKNTENKVDSKRKRIVYYINKIKFE